MKRDIETKQKQITEKGDKVIDKERKRKRERERERKREREREREREILRVLKTTMYMLALTPGS